MSQPITLSDIGGIGAPYNLSVPRPVEDLLLLDPEIAVLYTVLEGKHVRHEQRSGRLVKLSERQAELRSSEPIDPMNNVRLRFADEALQQLSDFYGKCLSRPATSPGCSLLRFTSMPADVKNHLTTVMKAAEDSQQQ